jgi:hypothetical protein
MALAATILTLHLTYPVLKDKLSGKESVLSRFRFLPNTKNQEDSQDIKP